MTREAAIALVSGSKAPAALKGLAILALARATTAQLEQIGDLVTRITADPDRAKDIALEAGRVWGVPENILLELAKTIEAAGAKQ